MRSITIAAPTLLLGYGIARWIDGLDGTHHNGPAWTVGHTMFFLGIVLFAVQAVALARRAAPVSRPVVAGTALAAALTGAGCFLWVITGDLFAGFDHDLPAWLNTAGPILFGLGMVTLLGVQAAAHRLPYWSPALFLVGYVSISVSLDLLPIAAAAILIANVPVARGVFTAPRREALT